jgi:hypothetical protein
VTADALKGVGVSAVFKPQGGSEVDTHVVFDTDVEAAGDRVHVAEDRRQLSCIRADVGIPTPGDVFTVDGTDYAVDGLPEDEAGDQYLIRVFVR